MSNGFIPPRPKDMSGSILSTDFKNWAVDQIKSKKRKASEIASDYSLNANTVRNWKRKKMYTLNHFLHIFLLEIF